VDVLANTSSMAVGKAWQLKSIARAAGAILRRSCKVVFCDSCRTARLDGPEFCPTCGGPLRSLRSEDNVTFAGDEAPRSVSDTALEVNTKAASAPGKLANGVRRGGGRGIRYTITFNGKVQPAGEWARDLGIPPKVIYTRIAQGLAVEDILAAAPTRKVSEVEPVPVTQADVAQVELQPYAEAVDALRANGIIVPVSEAPSLSGRRGPKARAIEFRGEALTIWQWSQKTGLRSDTIYTRLKRGWTVERALTEPEVFDRNPKTDTEKPFKSVKVDDVTGLLSYVRQWQEHGRFLRDKLATALDATINRVEDLEDAIGSIDRMLKSDKEEESTSR